KNSDEILPAIAEGIIPVIHCTQEIPCNPCSTLCPNDLIFIDENDIRSLPRYLGDPDSCKACERCVAGCPGLAITLVNTRRDPANPIVAIPYEFTRGTIKANDRVLAVDTTGNPLAEVVVKNVHAIKTSDRTLVVHVQAPAEIAPRIAGIRVQDPAITRPIDEAVTRLADDTIICRCERVTAGEIRKWIRLGCRDLNEIKAVARAGMGACGSKTCGSLVNRLFREEGIDLKQVTAGTQRPLFVEVPLGVFAGIRGEETQP
ncbi:MAG TPA: (2Fe-2S)-binding protein, partial [Anaerolineaceae bacterium]|nr:(2Fe-2S)-binding protein [Anaerolineaceae bacterium]